MIHTYRHTFRCGLTATILLDDRLKTFANTIVKWSSCPYGFNPQLGTDYTQWWRCVAFDFQCRTGKHIEPPVGSPGTWPTPSDGWSGIPPEG